jgi:16S rRNA processing protein RimM
LSSSSSLVLIGTVSKLHGFKGSLVVYTPTGKDSSLGSLDRIWLGTGPENAQEFQLSSSSWMPKGWKILLESVNSEEKARALVGNQVFAERTDLPQLEKGEFYLSDLLGVAGVEKETGRTLGYLSRLEESNPESSVKATFWVFTPDKTKETELFVPAVSHFIETVNLDEKIITLKNLTDLSITEEE